MLNSVKIIYLLLLWQFVLAADQAPPTKPNCFEHDIFKIEKPEELNGTWYTVASSPASRFDCIENQVHFMDNNKMVHVTVQRSENNSLLLLKDTPEAKFLAENLNNPAGFSMDFQNQPKRVFKILLHKDGELAICSYDADAHDREFGLILTRQKLVTEEAMEPLKATAKGLCSSFSKLENVKQSEKCFKTENSGTIVTSITPILIWAFSYIIVKVF